MDTVQQIESFVEELRRQEKSAHTLASYRYDLLLFARWLEATAGAGFEADQITPTDLREYRHYLLAVEQRSPATINRRLASLRTFFQWARAEGLCRAIPTDSVKGIQRSPRAPKALPKKDVDRLIREAEQGGNKRDLAVLQVLRHTGIRVGELTALRLADVTLSERKGQLIVRSGKGSKYRVVPLNADARKALSNYLAVRSKSTSDRLFLGCRSNGLSPRAVEKTVLKYAQQARLEDVSPHILRHTFGKSALDAGVDLVSVSRLMGHERLETTAIYTIPSAQDLEQAVEKLETDAWPGGLSTRQGCAGLGWLSAPCRSSVAPRCDSTVTAGGADVGYPRGLDTVLGRRTVQGRGSGLGNHHRQARTGRLPSS
jgi:site-specific recombinase XerD